MAAEIIDMTTPVVQLMREWKSEAAAYDSSDEAFDVGQHCDRENEIVMALISTRARAWRDVQLKLLGLRDIIGIQWADDRDIDLLESVLEDVNRLITS